DVLHDRVAGIVMRIRRRNSDSNERGTTMAEFALIASVFLMIIFGIIEFGRLLYTHNALTDATRRGARYAALHREAKQLCAQNVVIYGESRVNPTTCAGSGTPLINGLAIGNVHVDYQGADDDNDPNTPATSYGSNLGTATVTITDYRF